MENMSFKICFILRIRISVNKNEKKITIGENVSVEDTPCKLADLPSSTASSSRKIYLHTKCVAC